MSNKHTTVNSGGIGFLGALTLLFIALKLTGYIAWSWFWVLSPIIIPLTLLFLVFFVLGIFMVVKSK